MPDLRKLETSVVPGLRGRWWVLVVAAAAAVIGFLLAPEPWPEGPGSVEVLADDSLLLVDDVPVGGTEEVTRSATSGATEVQVIFPDGIPTDAPVKAVLRVEQDGRQLGLGEVELRIGLSNGDRELIPVLQEEGGTLEAARRPPQDADVVLALLGAVVVLWVTEAFPLFVTSLAIPVVLALSGAASPQDALAPFADPIIVLFFAGFLMAEAMRRVGLDHLASVTIIERAGAGPVRLFAVMLGFSALLSMFMSNTAAVAVLLPIALAVTEPLDSERYRKAVVLGIAYAATIGGVGSAIGTPANQLAIKFLDELTGETISFAEWFAYGLPMVVLFLPIMGVYLWRVAGVHVDAGRFATARTVAARERRAAGPLTGRQVQVLVVFGVVVVGWLTQTWTGFSPGIVALAGAVVLFVLGRILPEDLGGISWETLLTFGGGLTLGVAMVASGTSDWIVTQLDFLADWPQLAGVAIVAAVALALTTVASNTAAAATLIPLAVPLAGLIGVDPVLLVVVVAIASSIDFALVIGTPPTMLAYSTKLFTASEIFRRGILLDVVGLVLLVVVVTSIWRVLGLV